MTIDDRGPYLFGLDDLVEHWTLLKDEQGLVSGSAVQRDWASPCC
ncbi:hypothetical protein [Streptomyces oryzae]|nr:hypothetical protein [Streptomyces oryzae]